MARQSSVMPTPDKLEQRIGVSLVVLFCCTAAFKVLHIAFQPNLGAYADPIFTSLSAQRIAMLGVLLEIGAVDLWFLAPSKAAKWLGFLTVAGIFAAYKFTHFVLGIQTPCGCLGILTDWMPVSKPVSEAFTLVLPTYAALWSFAFINRHCHCSA